VRRAPARELLERIADRLKALGDPVRLELLHALQARERSVSELVETVGGSQANVSKHLARMRLAGIVAARREGTSVYYRAIDPAAFAICRTVCDALESRVDVERKLISESRGRLARAPRRRSTRGD
jgi:DNA-binding transcriptional ArsR family regulator